MKCYHGAALVGAGPTPARGFLGVYNLGGKREYVVVPRLATGKDEPDLAKLHPFTPTGHFFKMPPDVTCAIVDGYFYTGRPPSDEIFDGSVRMCHIDAATQAIGCRLCPDDPSRCTTTDDSGARPLIAPRRR